MAENNHAPSSSQEKIEDISNSRGPPPMKDDLVATAVDLADRAQKHITNYPHKLRHDPPLPHGVVEGLFVGISSFLLMQPLRSQTMRLIGHSNKWVGAVLSGGQAVIATQLGFYVGAVNGTYTWLSTLQDFASAPTDSTSFVNVHKSIMADRLCQDPIMASIKQQLAKPENAELIATAARRTAPPSIQDWMQPEKVVTEELVRVVAACHNRGKNKENRIETNEQ